MINKESDNLEHMQTYICGCGCNIEFQPYLLGWEMHLIYDGTNGTNGTNKLFIEHKMVNNSWYNYVDTDVFKTWNDLWNYIKNNKNTNNVMLHLYNQYKNFNAPLDSILSLDYIF